MKKIDFDIYVRLQGELYTDSEDIQNPSDVIDAVYGHRTNCQLDRLSMQECRFTDPDDKPLGHMTIENF